MDKALWRQAALGTSTAVAPTGVPTKQELVITANTYEFAGGAIVGSLEITIPQFAWKPYNITASGDDIFGSPPLEGQGIRPARRQPADDSRRRPGCGRHRSRRTLLAVVAQPRDGLQTWKPRAYSSQEREALQS